jgi:DNA-binding MarR family transcriptional regulator
MSTATQTATETVRQALAQALAAQRRLRGRLSGDRDELGYAHIQTLAVLGDRGETTAGELARAIELNPASVTALLDHLEQAGLVARRRSTEDRRVCHVALTDAGRETAARKLASWQARWSEGLAEFSDGELEIAARVLQRVAGIFDGVAPKH